MHLCMGLHWFEKRYQFPSFSSQSCSFASKPPPCIAEAATSLPCSSQCPASLLPPDTATAAGVLGAGQHGISDTGGVRPPAPSPVSYLSMETERVKNKPQQNAKFSAHHGSEKQRLPAPCSLRGCSSLLCYHTDWAPQFVLYTAGCSNYEMQRNLGIALCPNLCCRTHYFS